MSLLMLLLRRKQQATQLQSGFMPAGETLAPLMEGPGPHHQSFNGDGSLKEASTKGSLQQWMKEQLRTPSMSRALAPSSSSSSSSFKHSEIIRLLLTVLAAPLAPISSTVPPLSMQINTGPIETSSAQYILQQYIAATGGSKLQQSIKSSYSMGRLKMVVSEFETATKLAKGPIKRSESGAFVLWQMVPEMWYVEIAAGEGKVHAGSNGKLVWRHTPWMGSHAAKGPVRPLRRALQGLDPRVVSNVFANAVCVGEKKAGGGEDCFVLKVSADAATLSSRSEEGKAEIIRHVMFGLFSQKTGLLMQMEDSHLTRIQASCGDVVYWETSMESSLRDYRCVDGVAIAHGGTSVVTLFRFGEVAMSHSRTRMEEAWAIEEVAFNVHGLSPDCFIPPSDIKMGTFGEVGELGHCLDLQKGKLCSRNSSNGRVVALKKPQENHVDNIIWRVEI